MKTGSSTYSRIRGGRISNKVFSIGNKRFFGLSLRLGLKPLVLVKAKRGFVMCAYLNLKIAEKFGEAAAIVKAVNNINDLLKAEIVAVSPCARKLGVYKGMSGKEAILKLS